MAWDVDVRRGWLARAWYACVCIMMRARVCDVDDNERALRVTVDDGRLPLFRWGWEMGCEREEKVAERGQLRVLVLCLNWTISWSLVCLCMSEFSVMSSS